MVEAWVMDYQLSFLASKPLQIIAFFEELVEAILEFVPFNF